LERKYRSLYCSRDTTAEIAEISAHAIVLQATGPAGQPAGQFADNALTSELYSIMPAANSTLGARRPADLSPITQMAAQLDAQVEFLLNTHVRAHC